MHTFGHRSDLEADVDCQLLSHFEVQALSHGGKARGLGRQFVVIGPKGRGIEQAPLVRRDHTNRSRAESFEMYGGPGDRQRLGVGDGAGHDRIVALGESCNRESENQQHCEYTHTPILEPA